MEVKIPNANKITLLTGSDVYDIMRMVFKKQKKLDPSVKEYFWVIALNQHRKIVLIELISMGSIKATVVEPADVFTLPLHKRASSIILVHNHPSGLLAPSDADIDITTRLVHVGKTFNIRVADHVIITQNGYYSFFDSGKLADCEYDEKYALTFQKRAELEDEMERRTDEIRAEGEKIGRQQERKELVNKLVKQGIITKEQVEEMLRDSK